MIPQPVRKRNILLLTGLVMLVMAVVHEPSLLLFFLTSKGISHVFLMIMASFCTAMGFHELANCLLKNNGLPWYTRPGGFMAMILILVFVGILIAAVETYILPLIGPVRLLAEKAYMYEMFGMTLLWIVCLEWVTCKR